MFLHLLHPLRIHYDKPVVDAFTLLHLIYICLRAALRSASCKSSDVIRCGARNQSRPGNKPFTYCNVLVVYEKGARRERTDDGH